MENEKMDKQQIQEAIRKKDERFKLVKIENGKSIVWQVFCLIERDGQRLDYVCCSKCLIVFSYLPKNGTGALIRHKCSMIHRPEQTTLQSFTKKQIPKRILKDLTNEQFTFGSNVTEGADFGKEADEDLIVSRSAITRDGSEHQCGEIKSKFLQSLVNEALSSPTDMWTEFSQSNELCSCKRKMQISDTLADEYDDEDDDQTGNGQFESVYIAKTEIRQSQLNDSNESLSYQESHPEENEFIMSNLPQETSAATASSTTSAAAAAGVATMVVGGSGAAAASSVATGDNTPSATSSGCPTIVTMGNATCSLNQDDTFFLQYLGSKLGKYSASTKSTVQFHINRILYKADMGCYDNIDATKICESDA